MTERFREGKHFFPPPEFEIFPPNEENKVEANARVYLVTPPRIKHAHYYVSIVKPIRCISVSNLFYWSNTVYVSDGLSVHHQDCFLASSRQYLYVQS